MSDEQDSTSSIGHAFLSLFSSPTTSSTGLNVSPIAFHTDTLEKSNADPAAGLTPISSNLIPNVAPGTVSILDFARIVNTALNNQQQTANTSDTQTILNDKANWFDVSALAAAMVALQGKLRTLLNTESQFYGTEQQQLLDYIVNPLAAYNNVLSAATTTTSAMYNNQQSYLSSAKTTADQTTYNNEVATWNSNVAALNSRNQAAYNTYLTATNTLNNQITANNTAITAENANRLADGIKSMIPPEAMITVAPPPATLPTLSTVPPNPPVILPMGFPAVPTPSTDIISTSINITPSSPAEATFLNSVQTDFDTINNGTLATLNLNLAGTENATQTFNQAILAYQQGSISTATYNADVSNYLAYAAGINPTLTTAGNNYINAVNKFNTLTLPAINIQIATFNKARAANVPPLPPIPPQDPLPVPTLSSLLLPTAGILPGPPPPISVLVPTSIPLIVPNAPVGSITPTSSTGFLDTYLSPLLLPALLGMNAFVQKITLNEAYHAYQVFNLRGISNVNNSFIQQAPQVFVSPSPAAAVSGAALTASILGLSSKTLTTVLSGNILKNTTSKTKLLLPVQATEHFTYGTINALKTISLVSAFPALKTLGGHADVAAIGGPTASAAFSLNYLNNASTLVSSGATNNHVRATLANAGLSPAEISQVEDQVTAGLNLGLLQTGLLHVARSLGLPGLISQVIGNSTAGAGISQSLAAGAGYGTPQVLNNPVSVIALKQNITNAIVGQGIWDNATAERLVNEGVNKIIADNNNATINQFSTNVIQGFLALGLNDATVSQINDIAIDTVRSEQLNRDLDTNVVKQTLNNQILTNPLYQNPDLQTAIANLDQQGNISTGRQLRDGLVAQLSQTNDINTSRQIADNVLESIRSNDLKQSFNSQNLNQAQLVTSLINGLEAQGNSASAATATANSVATTVLAQNLNSELLTREAVQSALEASNINTQTAAELSANAALVLNNVNPLHDARSADILDHQTLAEALKIETVNQLKPSIGIEDASKIGNQLVLTILGSALVPAGPPATNEIVADQVAQPSSVLNQFNDAIANVRKNNDESANVALTADFRNFISPSVDLFNFLKRTYDPGNNLLLNAAWGIMYREGKGDLKSIDVRI